MDAKSCMSFQLPLRRVSYCFIARNVSEMTVLLKLAFCALVFLKRFHLLNKQFDDVVLFKKYFP